MAKICRMHKMCALEKACKIDRLWYNVREGMSSAKIRDDKSTACRRICHNTSGGIKNNG